MMNKLNKLIIPTFMATLTQPVFAQTLTDPLGGASIPTIIGRIIQAALGISGSLALIMFIYGGFIWMTSGGTPDRVTKGKKTLIWAVLGLVIIFTAYVLVDLAIRAVTSGEVSA